MLIMPAHGRHYSREILRLVLADFPVVLVDKKMEGIAVASVRTNGEEAMQQLVALSGRAGKKTDCSGDGGGGGNLHAD